MTLHDISYAQMITAQKEKSELDTAFENAVDDAVNQLFIDEYGCVFHSISYAYEVFINSLSISLELMMDPEGRQRLELCLPILAIADEDGLYIGYLNRTNGQLQRIWTDCLPYETIYDETKYQFYLSGTAVRTNKDGEEVLFVTKGNLETLRKETIARTIEEKVSEYISRHNRIANQWGMRYEFHIPAENNAQYSRAIQNPSLILLFEGYPLKGTDEVYQCFAFTGASIKKRDSFLITKKDWYLLYHKPNCTTLIEEGYTEEVTLCHTKEECASYGAYPCPNCVDLNGDYTYLTD